MRARSRINAPTSPLRQSLFFRDFQSGIITPDVLPPIPPLHGVINRPRILNASFPRRPGLSAPPVWNVKRI